MVSGGDDLRARLRTALRTAMKAREPGTAAADEYDAHGQEERAAALRAEAGALAALLG